jgi:hypothetical protein
MQNSFGDACHPAYQGKSDMPHCGDTLPGPETPRERPVLLIRGVETHGLPEGLASTPFKPTAPNHALAYGETGRGLAFRSVEQTIERA